MRQLLMLGFYCQVYRQEPVCRVYVKDVLVDEFNIPNTPRIDAWTADMILNPAIGSHGRFIHESSQSFYKFIEFDDFDSRSLDIRLEIQNNDNNFSNGFMTQHSLVMLSQCYLASVKFWENFAQINKRWKFNQYNWHGHGKSILHYYSGLRSYVFTNLAMYLDLHFPDITQQSNQHEQYKRRISNYQNLPQSWKDNPNEHWIGSSGYCHLTLAKKLGFWRHSTDRRKGWWKITMSGEVEFLYNKYLQHEDTRNTD